MPARHDASSVPRITVRHKRGILIQLSLHHRRFELVLSPDGSFVFSIGARLVGTGHWDAATETLTFPQGALNIVANVNYTNPIRLVDFERRIRAALSSLTPPSSR